MADPRVSAKARRDLERIGDVGAEAHGPVASARYVEGFRRVFRLLQEHRFVGRERWAPGAGVRSLLHRPYAILYRVDGNTVVIDRIIHQARDVGRALPGDH